MNVQLTPELARICAELTGDGHIQLMKHKRVGLISFYSKHYSEIKDFTTRFQKIFGLQSHVYPDYRQGNKRYKLFFFSRLVADYLVSIGVPAGNKTNQPFFVPDWIFNGTSEMKSEYLRGLFTTEGCISSTKTPQGPRWRIQIDMYKWEKLKQEGEQFMEQLVSMLNDFGIRCSPVLIGKGNERKDGTQSVSTRFAIERRSFENFYKHVGFCNEIKQGKLALLMRR